MLKQCLGCGNSFWADPQKRKYCSRACFVNSLVTHGSSYTQLISSWYGIKRRIFDTEFESYLDYGGRGITVCEEWLEFTVFRDWALANGYKDGLEIDRRNNDGNYCPDNCRWVTHAENSHNRSKSRNKKFTSKYKGVSWDKSRDKWVASIKVNYKKIHGGRFHTEIGAARCYDILAQKYFGEFANLNFPEETS